MGGSSAGEEEELELELELEARLDEAEKVVLAASSGEQRRAAAKAHAKSLLRTAQSSIVLSSKGGKKKAMQQLACSRRALELALALQGEFGSVGVPPLTLEKLLYRCLIRSMEEKDYEGGLAAGDLLRRCVEGGSDGDSEELSKLVGGALPNMARCCLEVGNADCLRRVGNLCEESGAWSTKASGGECVRDRMFQIAWRSASALERLGDSLGATACRKSAVSLKKGSVDASCVTLVHQVGSASEQHEQRKQQLQCLDLYSHCKSCWDSSWAPDSPFSAGFVDWLQHYASLCERLGESKRAKDLVHDAYAYVAKHAEGATTSSSSSSSVLDAYKGIVRMQMALICTTQLSAEEEEAEESGVGGSSVNLFGSDGHDENQELGTPVATPGRCPAATPPPRVKQQQRLPHKTPRLPHKTPRRPLPLTSRKRLRPELSYRDATKSEKKVQDMVSRGVHYMESCRKALEEKDDDRAFASAVVKAWRWLQRGCCAAAFWIEAGQEELKWRALQALLFELLGGLSLALLRLRDRVPDAVGEGLQLESMVLDGYLRASAAHSAQLGSPGADDSKLCRAAARALQAAQDSGCCSQVHLGRIAGGWLDLGRSQHAAGDARAAARHLERGCCLLEEWVAGGSPENETHLAKAQLHLRLSMLSSCLKDSGDLEGAAVAAARAAVFAVVSCGAAGGTTFMERAVTMAVAAFSGEPHPPETGNHCVQPLVDAIAARGFSPAFESLLTLGICRAFSACLTLDPTASLSTCAEGHRRCMGQLLGVTSLAPTLRAQALLQAAAFEHQVHAVSVMAQGASISQLDQALEWVKEAEDAAPRGALLGVCQCLRGVLLRDRKCDPHESFCRAVGLFGKMEGDGLGEGELDLILTHMELLEEYFGAQGDTLRRVRLVRLRFDLLESCGGQGAGLTVDRAGALSSSGLACHWAGLPLLAAHHAIRARELMNRSTASNSKEGEDGNGRRSADIVLSALEALLEAGEEQWPCEQAERALSDVLSQAVEMSDSTNSEAASFAHCIALMSMAWLLERQGKLGEAMLTLREGYSICVGQAARGPGSNDLHVVYLGGSRRQGEEEQEQEEGIGAGSRQMEEVQPCDAVLLRSRWLSLYLSAVVSMGRLWAVRGFPHKSSGYLQQGTLVCSADSQRDMLRRCLLADAQLASSQGKGPQADALLSAARALAPMAESGGQWYEQRCSVYDAELSLVEGDVHRRRRDITAALDCYSRGMVAVEALLAAAATETEEWEAFLSDPTGQLCPEGRVFEVQELREGLRWRLGRARELSGDLDKAEELYRACASSVHALPLDRASAEYRLAGMVGNAKEALDLLHDGLDLASGAGAPKLLRRLRRMAAVKELLPPTVEGGWSASTSWTVAALSSLSVGITHCNHMMHRQARRPTASCADGTAAAALFASVSGVESSPAEDLAHAIQTELPAPWTVVSMCLSPDRRLLVTRMQADRPPLTVCQQLEEEDTDILDELQALVKANALSLRAPAKSAKEKSAWWSKRTELDEALQKLLAKVEASWFGEGSLLPLLLGRPAAGAASFSMPEVTEEESWRAEMMRVASSSPPHVLEGRARDQLERCTGLTIASAPTPTAADEPCESEAQLSKMTVNDLKALMEERGLSFAGLKRKADYVAALLSPKVSASSSDSKEGGEAASRLPVILVLDERLQSVPWEGMRCLRDQPVTRLPALPFLFSALRAAGGEAGAGTATLGTEGGYFVLDPSGDLPSTAATMKPCVDDMRDSMGWDGVSGEPPSSSALVSALQTRSLFLYCGHGAGELLLGRDEVADLDCRAAAILMGCSSGRLKGAGEFEPVGMASGYLVGGSPAVVANLWDVSDRDIDRYSMALLEDVLRNEARCLASAVAQARSSCKMPYIVGASPVCYGIPLVTQACAAKQRATQSSKR
jgi:hypothetical protein